MAEKGDVVVRLRATNINPDEKSKLEEELKLRLERLRPENQMKKEAEIAENLNKQMKYRAMPRQIYVI